VLISEDEAGDEHDLYFLGHLFFRWLVQTEGDVVAEVFKDTILRIEDAGTHQVDVIERHRSIFKTDLGPEVPQRFKEPQPILSRRLIGGTVSCCYAEVFHASRRAHADWKAVRRR